jgi:hypothetical protein
MASELKTANGDGERNWTGVPMTVIIGAVVAVVGMAIQFAFGRDTTPGYASVAAITCAVAGVVVAALGVAKSPKNPIVLLIAGAASWCAMQATHPAWDSAQLLFMVGTGVAIVAAIVVCLPSVLQRVFVSFLVVFHFAGVFSAITSPPPQPAISNWAWVLLFRPHLVFCYTNNAYQFYSPDPGPASLLWFLVEFEDGKKTWFKMPRKPESRLDPMAVEFFRRLSLTEAVNQNLSIPGPPAAAIDRRRLRTDIPLHSGMDLAEQYRLPQELSRRLLSSYARHLGTAYGAHGPVKSIKIYRVLHRMMDPPQFAAGEDPFDPVTYLPYYMGEYAPDGTLKNTNDPMLFWLVPIVRAPAPLGPLSTGAGRSTSIRNYLAEHAGADPFDKATESTP